MSLLSIIAALIVFAFMVVVHEFGHYIAAVSLGIPVEEFSVGFGKLLYGRQGKATLFSIRMLPLGGYCRFVDANDEGKKPFNEEKPWKKLIVFVSGAAMNILLALLLSAVILLACGDYTMTVQTVDDGSPAQNAGMLPGDMLLCVDGKQIAYTFASEIDISQADSDALNVTVLRGGERKKLTLANVYNAEAGRNLMGVTIAFTQERRPFTLMEAASASADFFAYFVREFFSVILGIFKRPETASEQLGGPVAVVSIMSQAVRGGFEILLRVVVLLSANLGIVNLLPFPGLDGAHVVFTLVELIRRKPLSEKLQGAIQLAGFALLAALAVFLTFNDIEKLLGGV